MPEALSDITSNDMSIAEFFQKNQESLISLFGFAMVFVFGFFSGYYYLLDKTENRGVVIEEPKADCTDLFSVSNVADATGDVQAANKPDSTVTSAESEVKSFVASKNSKLFHIPTCSSALKIKEENKMWFSSIDRAESEGLSPHSCVNK